jgi:hypothetical protein
VLEESISLLLLIIINSIMWLSLSLSLLLLCSLAVCESLQAVCDDITVLVEQHFRHHRLIDGAKNIVDLLLVCK